eukprot:325629_1
MDLDDILNNCLTHFKQTHHDGVIDECGQLNQQIIDDILNNCLNDFDHGTYDSRDNHDKNTIRPTELYGGCDECCGDASSCNITQQLVRIMSKYAHRTHRLVLVDSNCAI